MYILQNTVEQLFKPLKQMNLINFDAYLQLKWWGNNRDGWYNDRPGQDLNPGPLNLLSGALPTVLSRFMQTKITWKWHRLLFTSWETAEFYVH